MFLYDILLQQCRKASRKILLASLHSSPLCFTLNYKASLSLTEFFPKRHKLYGYAIQNVNTHIPKSENQLDWWKGIQCWKTCQKLNSTDVAEELKPVYNTICSITEQFENQNSIFSSKVFCDSEKEVFSQAKDIQQERKSWKGIQENTSLSNIYWRCYWPGSYAPRGVIDQCICL